MQGRKVEKKASEKKTMKNVFKHMVINIKCSAKPNQTNINSCQTPSAIQSEPGSSAAQCRQRTKADGPAETERRSEGKNTR